MHWHGIGLCEKSSDGVVFSTACHSTHDAYYMINSRYLNLLIKKIGSAACHDLSRVVTHDKWLWKS